MQPSTQAYYFDGEDLILNIRVSTKASKNEIQEILENCVKVRINTPPVDGKANAFLKKFLGKQFGVAPSTIVIEAGELCRDKRFRIPSPTKSPDGFDLNHA